MSHVFNIIYTALLFLSPPLRQLSILLDHNQSVICQLLSILFLLHVSFWSWLCAASDGEKGKRSILENSHLIWGACSFSFWFSLERFLFKTCGKTRTFSPSVFSFSIKVIENQPLVINPIVYLGIQLLRVKTTFFFFFLNSKIFEDLFWLI